MIRRFIKQDALERTSDLGGVCMSDTYSLVEATMKVIQDRRSIRNYTDEPVADQELDMILEAAMLSGGEDMRSLPAEE